MSKLADRIRKVTRLAPQPIGFVRSQASAEPTMVLVAFARDAAEAADCARRGADAVVIGTGDAPATPETRAAAGEAIRGAWIAGAGDDDAKRFREAGYDFVVFDPDRAAATALLDEEIGYVLRLPADLTDVEARALEGFRLDLLDVGRIEGALTVRRQIDLQRLHALTRKPLLAHVAPGITNAALQALRDTNVAAIGADSADAVEALRKAIDALPPRARRKDESERPLAFVPRAAAGGGEDEDDDGD
ncbi:MAG TPA: hypothetical protein VFC53_02685 [Dehalococcoidia bacterium]|nr:hypothetical protein [Dehalococcoidia bacterium]